MRHPLILLVLAACTEAPPAADPSPTEIARRAPIPTQRPAIVPVQYAVPPPSQPPSSRPPPSRPPPRQKITRGPAGAKRVGTGDYWFGTGPGYVYSCQNDELRTWPKAGGGEFSHGPCHGAFQFLGDDSGTYFCDSDGVKRIPDQGDPELVTGNAKGCILDAIDDKFVYYVVPGFEGVKDPGLYRVAKRGGDPSKLHATRKGEQIFVVLDGEDLWMGAWGAGTISKMPKAGGTLTTVVTGQRGIVDLQIDGDSLYWYPENAGEIRKRAKRGGPISVVAKGLSIEPMLVHDGHVFWFVGVRNNAQTLMHLAPKATEPKVLASGLMSPSLVIDDEGVFFQEFGTAGIYMLPLPD